MSNNNSSITAMRLPFEVQCKFVESDPAAAPQVEAIAYTGVVMSVAGIGPVAVELSGIKSGKNVSILADHDATVGGVVGFGTVDTDGKTLRLQGTITSQSYKAKDIVNNGRAGYPWQASIGLDIVKSKPIDAGKTAMVNGKETQGPFLHVLRGNLKEVSIVPFGADANTSAIIASENKETEMDEQQEVVAAPVQAAAPVIDVAKLIADERKRTLDIEQVFAGVDYTGAEAIKAQAIADGWTVERAKASLFDSMKANAPVVAKSVKVEDAPNAPASAALEIALAASAGIHDDAFYAGAYGEHAVKEARKYSGIGLRGLMQIAAKHNVHTFNDAVIRAAFDQARVSASTPGISRIDLAGILGNVANKAMLDAYAATPVVATRLCGRRSVPDFKAVTSYRLTGGGSFNQVGPNGELKFIELGETSYTNQAHTYGQIFGLDRTNMINDDLGAFMRVPQIFGRNAQRLKDHLFFKVLDDTAGTYFTTGHGNYMSGATTALSSESLGAAEKLLLEQTDQDSHPIVVTGRYLLVPPALAYVARELYSAATITTGGGSSKDRQPAINVWQSMFEPIVSPYLSSATYLNSDTAWYIFADPSDIAAYEICYLNGNENPTIEQGDLDFQNLGIAWRAYIDIGVSEQDYRGAVMSLGAAS